MTILNAAKTVPMEGGPSFSLQSRLIRAAWSCVWLVAASWTPRRLVAWRRLLLRLFGARIAPTADIYPSARIWLPSNLAMGDFASLGPEVNCYCMDLITLEPYASVSQGAHLCTGTHDVDDPHFQLLTRPIVIGAHAWIAADAFVGPGVHIGEGAVLGARGVAFRDLEPNTVYIGNPARPSRLRTVRDQDQPANCQAGG
jgi:putative colanic acid biosynthesis acetyltransferase WcaF